MTPSAEAKALFRPLRTFRQLANAAPSEPAWLRLVRRPTCYLLFFGAFVSLSTAGRLVWYHVLPTLLFWAWLPALQVVGVLAVRALMRPVDLGVPDAVDRFFVSQVPWYVLFSLVSAVCLFSGDVFPTFGALAGSGALPIAFLATMIWGGYLTLACFRAGYGLSWVKSIIATVVFYAVHAGGILTFFVLTDQVQPLLAGPVPS